MGTVSRNCIPTPGLLIVILSAVVAYGQAQELPSNARSLKQSYEQAIERATTPITAKYLIELEKLKEQAAKSGNAEAVTSISAEIEVIKANTTKALDSAMTVRDKLLQAIWIGTEKNFNKWTVKFLPTGGLDMIRPDGSQGFTGWSWHIDDQNDLFITITGSAPQKVDMSKRVDRLSFSWGTLVKHK